MASSPDSRRVAGVTLCVLTARTAGAIAVIRLDVDCAAADTNGDAAIDAVLADHFQPLKLGGASRSAVARHGVWADGDGAPIDEVLVVRWPDGAVEVHAHASRAIVDGICRSVEGTVAPVSPSAQARQERVPDSSVGAALHDVFKNAATSFVARLALRQAELYRELVDACVNDLAAPAKERLRVLESADAVAWGRAVLRTPVVVLAGAPNAGKSALANALAGSERCLVSPIAGTTRDAVAMTVALDGVPVRLVDVAGLPPPAENASRDGATRTIERAAAARAIAQWRSADVAIVLSPVDDEEGDDASSEDSAAMWRLVRWRRRRELPVVRVRSKADLLPQRVRQPVEPLCVSGSTGLGVDRLKAAILAALGLDTAWPFRQPIALSPTRRWVELARAPDSPTLLETLREARASLADCFA